MNDPLNAALAAQESPWVTEGTWVTFDQSTQAGQHAFFPLIGFVFEITPCGRAAVLVPFAGMDEVHIIDPGQVIESMRPDEVKKIIGVAAADIDSITFDRAERQLRIDAVEVRVNA